jgi:DNA-binding MarR family transcriptional regulator
MIQPSFNFESLSRRSDPASSKRAAQEVIESGTVRNHEAIIVDLLRMYPGSTTKQLAGHGPLDRYQVARRMKELEKRNIVRRTSEGSEECRWWAV